MATEVTELTGKSVTPLSYSNRRRCRCGELAETMDGCEYRKSRPMEWNAIEWSGVENFARSVQERLSSVICVSIGILEVDVCSLTRGKGGFLID